VVFVQETPTSSFWGCGECGNVWHDRKKLNAQIQKICNKYSYRSACYIQDEKGYTGIPLKDEPENYRDRVIEEDW